jgi:hypothetical protein
MDARGVLIVLAIAFALASAIAALTTIKQVRTETSSVPQSTRTI